MDSKETAKKEVEKLIKKYELLLQEGRVHQYQEANTRKDFILPLFAALGWEVTNIDEVDEETAVSRGRVDYSFKLSGVARFYLEAKALKADLEKQEYAEQAIDYAYNKGVPWAVLTDFEKIKLFNAEWKAKTLTDSQFFELAYTEYLNKFDQLWLLSKEAISQGLLDKEAERWGKKDKKQPISKQILSDLLKAREKLTKNIIQHARLNKISEEELDESVQRILDRLIFIRTCEDRNIEQNCLSSAKRLWRESRRDLSLALQKIFRDFDNGYNSKLFEKHLCENLTIDNEILAEIIQDLYQTPDGSRYDFSAISADVLGNIYEQYLGHILKKTSKSARLKETYQHRKEMGIYYTPTYIVDYIVKNTLGEILKKTKPKNVNKIKVLDPACGSGSFLIRAFDEFLNYWQKHSPGEFGYFRKIEILKNNLYGVDLDKQAVEIAQMNLLLKTLYHRERLPMLEHIKQGNSLISGTEEELKKYFAENWQSKHPFAWEDEFPEIFPNGCHCERERSNLGSQKMRSEESNSGFDVVIGNPPYSDIKGMNPEDVKYLFDKFITTENRINLYASFVERALKLLKNEGYFGFIIPNSILYNDSYRKLREQILKFSNIRKIVRLPDNVFVEAKVETIILVLQKKRTKAKTDALIYDIDDIITDINYENCKNHHLVVQSDWEGNEKYVFNIFSDKDTLEVINKIEQNTTKLKNLCDFSLGLTPYDKYKGHTQEQIKNRIFHASYKKSKTFKKLLSGEDIVRYGIFWNGKEWINYGPWLGAPREERFFTQPRILVRQIVSGKPLRIFASYTEEELYDTQIAFSIIVKDRKTINEKYLLAILNSKLMNFYHTERYLDKSKNLFQKVLIINAKQFPIKVVSQDRQQPLIDLVDKMLTLNKELRKFGDKLTDERKKIESEIQKTDKEIDELVYKLYGLTEKEIKMVEGK